MDTSNPSPRQAKKPLSARRMALLGSVALVGAAVAFGGPLQGHAFSGNFGLPTAHAAESRQGPASFADLVAKVKPAVISVRVDIDQTVGMSPSSDDEMQQMPPFMQGSPFDRFFHQFGEGSPDQRQQSRKVTGVGSGFFISADGYAVTNNHVVDHASSVQITTDDGTKYDAKVIGTDPKTDIALIKVDGKRDFSYVNFASAAPRVGDWVVAVGNPFGLGGTVTAGIVSAQGRDIGSGAYDYLQVDAPINKGNSGGPTFDMNGTVVGVNTAIYSPSGGSVGIGFDVPAQTAQAVIAQLKDKGSVTRGWLGIQIQPVTADVAEGLGLKNAEGALVAEAQPNSPAAKAGVRSGDVITAVNGKTLKDSRELAREIAALGPGSSIKLDVIRDGGNKTLAVTLGTMPNERQANAGAEEPPTQGRDVPHLGLNVAPATDVAGSGDKGVVVTSVDTNGAAAASGVQTGDVILNVGGQSVSSAADIRKALTEAKDGGRNKVLMRVKTAEATRFIAVPIG